MRSVRHWTAQYLMARLKLMAYQKANPNAPWLTAAMIEILESWLRPSDVGLEWGSGRSTLWFARRVGHIISVEHDGTWYRRISAEIQRNRLASVDYRLREDEAEYVATCDEPLPKSLNFILVDGIARDQCARRAIPRLCAGGILIVDNINWYLPSDSKSPSSRREDQGALSDGWREFVEQVKDWRHVWTTNGVFDTAMWVNPY